MNREECVVWSKALSCVMDYYVKKGHKASNVVDAYSKCVRDFEIYLEQMELEEEKKNGGIKK